MDEFEALLSKFEETTDEPGPPGKAPKLTILVVDDDESMRRGLTRILSENFDVTAAENGKRAIEESERRQFYAVVLDIKMPGMNGFEVCEILAKNDADLPIIFYTAFQSEHDLQAILNIYRPFAYLDKGGQYDIQKTVRRAVDQYSGILQRALYQKELETKTVDLGMRVQVPKPTDLLNVPNIVGKERLRHHDSGQIEIRDFNTRELLGFMPDVSDDGVENAIAACREQLDWWRRLTVNERMEIIAKAGRELKSNDRFDAVIPRSGWFARKVSVIIDRLLTAAWMMKSTEYMKWAFGEERVESDIIEGVGTVGIIIQSSMFQTGAYGIIDALRAGNSVLIKLDSRDPYPEYLVGSTLAEAGAPVQIISVDTKAKPHIGRKIIDGLDKVVFMGNPYKVIEIAYGEAIQQLGVSGGISSEDITSLKKKLMIPAKVISYTAHLGGAYIDKSADIETAVRLCGYSSTSHYRSCKRLKVLTIHPHVYAEALSLLKRMFTNLKIGSTTDPDAYIVETNDKYWERFVGPYLEETQKYGEIVFGAEERSRPKIIEINPEWLPQGEGIGKYLGQECMFPLLIVIKGDENIGIYATKVMAEHSHDGMILEYSVFTKNKDIFRFIEKHGYAFNYHLNEPTTWGLGNPDKNRFRFHQRRILAMDLAGTRVG